MNARAPDRPAAADHRAGGRVAAAQTEGDCVPVSQTGDDLLLYDPQNPDACIQANNAVEVGL